MKNVYEPPTRSPWVSRDGMAFHPGGGGAVSSPFFFWSTITSLAIFQSAHVCILWFSSSFFRKE